MTTRSPESYSPSRDAKRRKRTENEANCFKLENNETYEGTCPVFQQPRELTSYSIDHNRRVWFDNREMKYYYPPTTGKKDLNEGYERMIQRDESISEHIDTLLDALTHFNSEAKEAATADIVTWRGIMTKILCTPYARREPWELRATRYKDTIYLEEQTTEQKKQQESQATEKQKRMSYWGYRFETLCTLSKPPHLVKKDDQELQDRLVQNVNTNIQYCILVKTKLGSSSIIMGAEVDCCRDVKPNDSLKQPSNYIELKTSRIIETDRNQYSFERYKLLKFWAQSFLVGVPRIICGFRDDEGYVLEIKQFKTMEIPRLVRERKNTWNPSVCLNFANALLEWIKSSITKSDAAVTYSIQFKYPFEEIKIECTGHAYVFLTQRYLNGTVQQEIGGPRVPVVKRGESY